MSTLMADAGLTNGAFYVHFASKEDLVTAAVVDQLRAEKDRFSSVTDDSSAFERIVREYLSPGHRDDPAHGCPTATLVAEIGRSAGETRSAYTRGVLDSLGPLAANIGDEDQDGRAAALAILGAMSGTLQIARAVSDPDLSDAILIQGIRNVLSLMP
ncbi:TetR/AcrR family transcriptional regulator [Microbacterium sp. cx-55]|nr:TetR/AcrR family transcriptional regulator [Microbacterium sp. cx-55]UGB36332.1 TetR/AcrR family transcriptional regulator [Microbacterium sp. cx-55]